MSVKELEAYKDPEKLYNRLKKEKYCPPMLLLIVWFSFLPMTQSLMKELDAKFNKKAGPQAIPRTALLIATLYSFSLKIDNYQRMASLCTTDHYLRIAIDDLKISRGTFSNFLNKSDEKVMDKVFASTLVLLNDNKLLDIVKLFVDGTDLLVRASKHFRISRKEVKALRLLGKWNLIHDGSPKGIQRTQKKLNEKLNSFMYMGETEDLIKLALKRIKIYNNRNYKKLHEYEAVMSIRGVDKCSIVFPSAVYMKTKKQVMDYAFNLQEVINQDHVIITGFLLKEPNDQKAFPAVYEKLQKTMQNFYELQEEFGERNNGDGIKNKLLKAIFVADAGYFTNKNLYFIYKMGINAIIMPKIVAEYINNKNRENKGIVNRNSSIKIKYERVKNGYLCLDKRFMKSLGCFEINKRKEEEIKIKYQPISSCSIHYWHRIYEIPEIPEILQEKTFKFARKHCKGCNFKDKCTHNPLVVKTTPLLMKATEKFLNLKYRHIYAERFSRSESINGYYKGQSGICKLVGTTVTAVNNEVNLKNALYNLTLLTNKKGISLRSILTA